MEADPESRKNGPPAADPPGGEHKRAWTVPPRQRPHERACELAFEELVSRELPAETLEALGVTRENGLIHVPVLNSELVVDLSSRRVIVGDGGAARTAWALLALHYLCARDVSQDLREVSFGHFHECRGYLGVFRKRIIGRFLATVGGREEQFQQACERLGATRVAQPGISYRFNVLPRVPITIVRHGGDDELGPDANVIYSADVEHLLPAEDCVVAAELLLDTLSGAPIHEATGGSDERRR
ncbi:MAG: hypothetical protein A2Z18_11210 [Armatimonadetes bacterium RBG_16_58_9]|nr:MAG: hypothetical protein A2Z18_11210 [Armatimonadetes bacterium RBG_16_58_9]